MQKQTPSSYPLIQIFPKSGWAQYFGMGELGLALPAKTLNINISGTVFHIDDDAFEKLKSYLSKINVHFKNEEDFILRSFVGELQGRVVDSKTEDF